VEGTVREPGPGLPDGCGFWLGTAAFFVALGAIGITIAVTEYHPPWPAAWFIAGSVICALGCVAAIWALVLYLAHREAERHWCPDSRAHVPETQQREPATQPQGATTARARAILRAADAVSRGDLARWLRPVLREINGDLRQAAAGIEKACREGSYRDVRHEFNLGQTWEDNRQRLAALEGRGDLYDTIRDAYAGIARMHRIAARSRIAPTEAQDLGGALEAIRNAESAVGKELAELG
jgi:hypothetical protein